ncbi:MAG TPA: hypothetical protein VG735_14690 [Caulobacterales bacterium]|jgi:uncharacterized protein (UPF0332 family)|nr:hypothetical protein [Caulobacterales bacterium]
MAGLHAANALIFERTDAPPKAHRGANIVFARLAQDEPAISEHLRGFLGRYYVLKDVSDYGLAPGSNITPDAIQEVITDARLLIDAVRQALV